MHRTGRPRAGWVIAAAAVLTLALPLAAHEFWVGDVRLGGTIERRTARRGPAELTQVRPALDTLTTGPARARAAATAHVPCPVGDFMTRASPASSA